ncbi:MAG TPA: TonB family protein [Cytophagales bacterium]|nr:TonB family protein [Cytophagales bacterium]
MNQEHLSETQLLNYRMGKMNDTEMYQTELHLLECTLCNDALEGFETESPNVTLADLQDLKGRLAERLSMEKKRERVVFWPMTVAASLLLIGFISLFFLLDNAKKRDQTYARKEAPVLKETENNYSPTPLQSSKTPEQKETEDQTIINTEKVKKREVVIDRNKQKIPVQQEQSLAEAETIQSAPSMVADETSENQEIKARISDSSQLAEVYKREIEEQGMRQSASAEPNAKVSRSRSMNFEFIKGKVTDEDGQGLPGVSVALKGTTTGTITDENGNYQISLPSSNAILVFSSVGYNPSEIEVDKNQTSVNAQLNVNATALAEIVVVGYSTEGASLTGNSKIIRAKPAGGHRNFKNYIRENTKYPTAASGKNFEGKVVVEFNVNTDGTLSDFTIKKPMGYGLDDEAIRLIKEGPGWIPGMLNGTPIQQKIAVKVPFKRR